MGYFTPVIRKYLKELSHLATGCLLDVGCGNKPYKDVLKHVGDYIGIDRPSMARINDDLTAKRIVSIDVVGSAESLPFADVAFNTVLATQLIEHLGNPGLFLKEAARVLAPGGCLILTFPLINPLHEEPFDYFRFTEYAICFFCHKCGLKVEKCIKMGGGWLSVGYLIRHFMYLDSEKAVSKIRKRLLYLGGSLFYGVMSRLDLRNPHPEAPLNYLAVLRKAAQ